MRHRRWLLWVGVVALLLAVACQGQTATPTPGPSVGEKVVSVSQGDGEDGKSNGGQDAL